MNYFIIFFALLPVGILVYYIYHKDRYAPEPAGQLLKAFLFGILSVPLSFCMSVPFQYMGLYPAENIGVLDGIRTAFLGAAVPEEIAKLFMLWLLLRRNKFFDEKMDGIVYAVFVSLGFAALENVMYLFAYSETFVLTGFTRAIFAVPGHFCFGVLMGYYYSMARFYSKDKLRNRILIFTAPILAHGVYDSILFIINVSTIVSSILTIVFLVFCRKMWKYASNRINEHLKRDNIFLE